MELSLAVQGALARLSEDQREAVLLKVYQGFKFEEMAEILACPVSTIKSRLYTALDLLKQTSGSSQTWEGRNELFICGFESVFSGRVVPRGTGVVEKHVRACAELPRRAGTFEVRPSRAALARQTKSRRQRIAFVSDKVFEPRWWQTIWRSGPAMGFASAASAGGGDPGACFRAPRRWPRPWIPRRWSSALSGK